VKIKDIRLKPLFSKFKKPYVWAMGKNLGQITILVEIETEDKNIVIAGRSRLVTSPLSKILSSKKFNGNVSVIHSKTSNPKDFVSKADIFISAVGKSKMFDKSYFKEGSYVIDVGISVVDGKSYGDIDTADLDNYLLGRAPYPGGIGPITVSALYSNLAQLIS